MKQHLIKQTYQFIHNDISVYVRIDYRNDNISILECTDRNKSTFKKKDFTFINRGVKYMQGWRDILEAISEATKDAEAKSLANSAEEDKETERMIKSIGKEVMKK
jgi:hypothetical protein